MTIHQIPEQIQNLISRCEAGEEKFDNDDMSDALYFGQKLWAEVQRLIDHYERISDNYMPWDERAKIYSADIANELSGFQKRITNGGTEEVSEQT
jgi:flagellar biosynthesis regulator FlaF